MYLTSGLYCYRRTQTIRPRGVSRENNDDIVVRGLCPARINHIRQAGRQEAVGWVAGGLPGIIRLG